MKDAELRLLQKATQKRNQSSGCNDEDIVEKSEIDLFVEDSFKVKFLKYDQETKSYTENKIDHKLQFVSWTDEGMEFMVNFTYPLQVSQGSKPDMAEVMILSGEKFKSAVSDRKFDTNQTEQWKMQTTIPKQLANGFTEE